MESVVFLRPQPLPQASIRSHFSFLFHGRPLVFMVIAILTIFSLSITVSGTSFDYYPTTCLGSWTNPENAQGKPNIKTNLASSRSFTMSNSSVFFGGTHSIICQNFSGESIPPEATLSSLTLTLSLGVRHPVVESSSAGSSAAPEDGENTGITPEEGGADNEPAETGESFAGGFDESEFTIVDEPVDADQSDASTGDGWETAPSEDTPVEEASESEPDSSNSSESSNEESSDSSAGSESSDSSAGGESSESSSDSSDSSGSSESSSGDSGGSDSSEPSAFWNLLVPSARAQDQAGVLATVLYSVGGDEWQALGHITQEEWRNLEFKIPVGQGGVLAVGNIPDLRIRVDAGFFGVDNPTEVYLDGMAIEIRTDEFVSNDEIPEPQRLDGLTDVPGTIQSVGKTLSLLRNVIPAEEVLPWQPLDFQNENTEAAKDVVRSVAVSDSETGNIIISGTCLKDYYVILVFRGENDYATSPRSALFNSAYACKRGAYKYEMTPGSLNLKTGSYFMLVAEQDDGEPWVPISALMPFEVE